MNIPAWYDKLQQKPFLQIFTIYTRYLVGGAFFIAAIGMGKLDGSSNLMNAMDKPIQELQPIQQFFRVMTDSGLYWQFIGWSQIITGILLMTQRFARLGALIFFGLILNIFIITISYDFRGTPLITGLMLLAATYLLLWDIRTFLPLLTNKELNAATPLPIIEHRYWAMLGIMMVISIVLAFIFKLHILFQLGFPFFTGLIGFIYYLVKRKNFN
jgi:uncharacterized membrane protein YphA (DoxX/SURF4 family)